MLQRYPGRFLTSEDFEHHRTAGGTLTLHGLPAVFHGLFHTVGNRLFRLTFHAIAIGHIKYLSTVTAGVGAVEAGG